MTIAKLKFFDRIGDYWFCAVCGKSAVSISTLAGYIRKLLHYRVVVIMEKRHLRIETLRNAGELESDLRFIGVESVFTMGTDGKHGLT